MYVPLMLSVPEYVMVNSERYECGEGSGECAGLPECESVPVIYRSRSERGLIRILVEDYGLGAVSCEERPLIS
jgi:hypothetical protein